MRESRSFLEEDIKENESHKAEKRKDAHHTFIAKSQEFDKRVSNKLNKLCTCSVKVGPGFAAEILKHF